MYLRVPQNLLSHSAPSQERARPQDLRVEFSLGSLFRPQTGGGGSSQAPRGAGLQATSLPSVDSTHLLTLNRLRPMRKHFCSLFAFSFLFALTVSAGFAQAQGTQPASGPAQAGTQHVDSSASPAPEVCAACIHAHMEFLASDALRGRGSGTPDELVAATYIASQLRLYGIEPAGDDGGYIQRAPVVRRKLTAPPQLKITMPGTPNQTLTWTYGKEFLVMYLG